MPAEITNVINMSHVCLTILKELRNWKTQLLFSLWASCTHSMFSFHGYSCYTLPRSILPSPHSFPPKSLYFVFVASLHHLFLLKFNKYSYLHIHFPWNFKILFFCSLESSSTMPVHHRIFMYLSPTENMPRQCLAYICSEYSLKDYSSYGDEVICSLLTEFGLSSVLLGIAAPYCFGIRYLLQHLFSFYFLSL